MSEHDLLRSVQEELDKLRYPFRFDDLKLYVQQAWATKTSESPDPHKIAKRFKAYTCKEASQEMLRKTRQRGVWRQAP